MIKPLQLEVLEDGQEYFDVPVYEVISNAKPLALAVNQIYANGHTIPSRITDVTGYERTRLRWMKPGPGGKLVPR